MPAAGAERSSAATRAVIASRAGGGSKAGSSLPTASGRQRSSAHIRLIAITSPIRSQARRSAESSARPKRAGGKVAFLSGVGAGSRPASLGARNGSVDITRYHSAPNKKSPAWRISDEPGGRVIWLTGWVKVEYTLIVGLSHIPLCGGDRNAIRS